VVFLFCSTWIAIGGPFDCGLHLLFVREAEIDAEFWVDKTFEALLRDFIQGLRVFLAQLHNTQVLLDARWGHGFGQHGAAPSH
jgi:hypothetical protein